MTITQAIMVQESDHAWVQRLLDEQQEFQSS